MKHRLLRSALASACLLAGMMVSPAWAVDTPLSGPPPGASRRRNGAWTARWRSNSCSSASCVSIFSSRFQSEFGPGAPSGRRLPGFTSGAGAFRFCRFVARRAAISAKESNFMRVAGQPLHDASRGSAWRERKRQAAETADSERQNF